MSEFPGNTNLIELITPDTIPKEFEAIVDSLISNLDREILGEEAFVIARNSLLYLSAFATEPATFERDQYLELIARDQDRNPLSDKQTAQLMDFNMRIGVMKSVDQGYVVNAQATSLLLSILEKYEE